MLDGSTDSWQWRDNLACKVHKEHWSERCVSVSLPLDSATADGYLDAIQEEVGKHGILGWLSTYVVIGIGTDHAASMTGAENSVI
jgi:hypothetical protein